MFDTGSANVWVPDSDCAACRKRKFNRDNSSTFATHDDTLRQIEFGTGELTLQGGEDVVHVGGKTVRVRFSLAETESSHFDSMPFDGLVGLDPRQHGGLLQALADSHAIDEKTFTITLKPLFEKLVRVSKKGL
eukprot:GEMP01106521.1.p1 GENE.GEMP01106521.1~~GEMP01106521.1.p1  ORF type:complete len:133 (+),score=37.19 GEMP01106521.1:226-624(+)